ncbi:hypothetical protein Peur_071560 [Populus x canadensis]
MSISFFLFRIWFPYFNLASQFWFLQSEVKPLCISHGPCRLDSLTNKWTCHSLRGAFIYLACNASVRTQNEHAGWTAVRGLVPFLRGGEDNDEGQQCTHCPVKGHCFIMVQIGDAIALLKWP